MWKLLLFGIGMSVIICLVIRAIGKREIRKDYERDFADLVHFKKVCKVTPKNKIVITNKFRKVERYRCKDKEQVSVLKGEIYYKFNLKNGEL